MKHRNLVKRVKQLEKRVDHLGNYVSYLVKSGDLTDAHDPNEPDHPEEQPQETTENLTQS